MMSGSNFYGKKLKKRLSVIYREPNEIPHRKGVNSMVIDYESKWPRTKKWCYANSLIEMNSKYIKFRSHSEKDIRE
jgi:hypothetical protein